MQLLLQPDLGGARYCGTGVYAPNNRHKRDDRTIPAGATAASDEIKRRAEEKEMRTNYRGRTRSRQTENRQISAHSRPAAFNAANGDEDAAAATVKIHGNRQRDRGGASATEACNTHSRCRKALLMVEGCARRKVCTETETEDGGVVVRRRSDPQRARIDHRTNRRNSCAPMKQR